MRSILLHIHEDDCLEARFQVALELARQFDGHLTCLQAIPYEFGVPGDFYGSMAAQLAVEFGKNAQRIRETYEKRLKSEDVRYDWHDSDGSAPRLIGQYAPLSDIVIVGAHNPVGGTEKPSSLVTELIGTLRAPMLVVPAALKSLPPGKPAAIAWNGSAEAAHAIKGAMPVIRQASEVHILSVKETGDGQRHLIPSTKAAEYLARHGVKAQIVQIPHDPLEAAKVADKLLNAAEARKVGVLIMGAYGRSRLRERILGGVTRDLLKDPAIPLLMAH